MLNIPSVLHCSCFSLTMSYTSHIPSLLHLLYAVSKVVLTCPMIFFSKILSDSHSSLYSYNPIISTAYPILSFFFVYCNLPASSISYKCQPTGIYFLKLLILVLALPLIFTTHYPCLIISYYQNKCCVTNQPQTQQLTTTSIYFSH